MKGLNLANSSTKNERKEADFYPTPPDVTQALIDTGGDFQLVCRKCGNWEEYDQ